MSTLLRSSKFIRCFSTVCRNVSIRPGKLPSIGEKFSACCAVKHAQLNFTRSFAVEAHKERQSVERCLHNLDFEVRQKGRISGKDIEDVIYAVKSTGEISSSQALLLIRCCGTLVIEEAPQKRTELAGKVMSTLKELGVPLDISHYNALLKVYLENRTEFSPFEFLQELEKGGIIPNRVTYQYLIGSFCINGDIVGATKILELMKENKIPINEIIFNYLIIGHSEANDIESAADIINIMKEKGIEPSAASYAALLCGYAKVGDIEKVREIFNFCEKDEIGLLDKDYMDIIFALTTNEHSQHVDEVLNKMKKSAGYNQDIVNLSFRLINEGHDDVAIKIVKTMVASEHYPQNKNGSFLIHFLLRNNQPIQRIVKIAKMLRDEGINEVASITALREMLIRERKEDAIFLIRNLKENGMEIRPHYFYPLFCQAGRNKDNKMVLELLRLMRYLNVPRGFVTVKNFIVPNYRVRNVIQDFGQLWNAGVHSEILAEALFSEFAIKEDLKSCELLATNFYLSWDKRYTNWLISCLDKTGDVTTFVNIHAHLFDCYLLEYKIIGDDEVTVDDIVDGSSTEIDSKREPENLKDAVSREKEFGEYVIRQLANNSKSQGYLEAVIKGLLANGISIRESSVESLSKYVGDAVPIELLQKLASPELKPKPVEKSREFLDAFPTLRVVKPSSGRAEFSEEDRHFIYLVNSKLVTQAEEMFEKFKAADALNKFRYANMVKLLTLTRSYDKAAQLGDEMQAKYPDELCSEFLSLYYVEALINVNRFDDGFAFLKSLSFIENVPEQLFQSLISRFIGNTGDLEKAQKLMEMGIEKNIISPRHFHTIVNECLRKKDYEFAANLFVEVAEKYKHPLAKNQILREMVESGNPELLEKVTNSLAELNGQINSLLDLTVAFAESNKVKQVRRLLETPGLLFRPEKIRGICERFVTNGNETAIECLVSATKGMTKFDRGILYDYYLECNLRNDDPAKALNIWTQMQEEDITPSDEFLLKLSTYLKGKGLPVPFAYKDQGGFELDPRGKLRMVDSIAQGIEENDFDKICNSLEYLVRAKRRVPYLSIITYMRNEIVEKGDVEKLKRIRSIFPAMKPYVTWESMLLIAHNTIGKRKEYLLDKVEELSIRRAQHPLFRIPFRTLLNLSLQDPTLLRELEDVEEIAKGKGLNVYSGVLWAYHIVNNNFEAAKNYSPSNVREVVNLVKNFGFVRRNAKVLETLLKIRDDYQLDDEIVGSIYNDLLQLHKLMDEIDNMQNCLDRAIEDKKENFISKDLITYLKIKTKPSLEQLKGLKKRNAITTFTRNFHKTRRFCNHKKLDSSDIEPGNSNRENSFFTHFKNHILQDCSPQIKFLMKDQISALKNTCYWIMKVNHSEEPKAQTAPKETEEKKLEDEEYDLVSHFIGFQSSSISTQGEKDWMKFLKDDSGLLFSKDQIPTSPVPKIRPEYKPPLINMPLNPEDVVVMDLIDEGSNEEVKAEKPTFTPVKPNLEEFEEDLDVPQKSQWKDI